MRRWWGVRSVSGALADESLRVGLHAAGDGAAGGLVECPISPPPPAPLSRGVGIEWCSQMLRVR